MKRPLRPEEVKVWGLVTGTVRPLPGRVAPNEAAKGAAEAKATDVPARVPVAKPPPVKPRASGPKDPIEPRRKHRIARKREEIGARLDLHGLDQDRARPALEGFLSRAFDHGVRAVLVITGKGVQGDGVLRRRVPEWLAAPHLSHMVAGISEAARHHGGAGALYVALKKKRA
ncbi:Smr/MutS family protein [Phenylobacterium sp.]|uniref:Smr/MutS family protein n=1 Tax=Phenylobacterium sp. TaxID=1871053 RepID=UPI003784A509